MYFLNCRKTTDPDLFIVSFKGTNLTSLIAKGKWW